MAGDWIQKDTNLREKPEFIRLVDLAHEIDAFQDIPAWALEPLIEGLLLDFWGWLDGVSDDGVFIGITTKSLARKHGACPEFWESLSDKAVNWLEITDAGIAIPGFEKRFSQSAKTRLRQAKWAASKRKSNKVDKASTPTSTQNRQGVDLKESRGEKSKQQQQAPVADAEITTADLSYDPDANPYRPTLTPEQEADRARIHETLCRDLKESPLGQFWRDVALTCATNPTARKVASDLLKRIRDGTIGSPAGFFRKNWIEHMRNATEDQKR